MEKPKLSTILVCDSIITDTNGKNSLIGIFGEIYATKFPAIHPHMVVFVSLLNNSFEGKLKMDVVIVDSNSKQIIADIKDFVIKFEKEKNNYCIFNFDNVRFNQEGDYLILVKIDGQEIAHLTIKVTYPIERK